MPGRFRAATPSSAKDGRYSLSQAPAYPAVAAMVAEGMSAEEILAAYPDLEREDITASLGYATEAVRE